MEENRGTGAQFSLHYRFSKNYRASIYFALVLFLILPFTKIYFGIFDRQTPNRNALFVVGLALLFLGIAIYCFLMIPRLYAEIIIFDDRITQQYNNGSSVSIRWEEISKMTVRRYLSRLEIKGVNSEKVIFIESQIQGYEEIVDIIGAKLNKAERKPPISHCFP